MTEPTPQEQAAIYRDVRQRLLNPPVLRNREVARLEKRNEELSRELAATVAAKETAENSARLLYFAITTRVFQRRPLGGSMTITRRIIAEVARAYSVDPALILTHTRERSVSEARHVAVYITRTFTHRSFPQIGRDMDRDHSTLVAAYQNVKRRMASDPDFAATVAEIRAAVEKEMPE